MKKADRLQSRAMRIFETAHGDLLESARLNNEEAIEKNARAAALARESADARFAAQANTNRATALGQLLGL